MHLEDLWRLGLVDSRADRQPCGSVVQSRERLGQVSPQERTMRALVKRRPPLRHRSVSEDGQFVRTLSQFWC